MRGLFPLVPKSQQLSVTLGAQGLWELFTLHQSSTITKLAQTCPQTPGALFLPSIPCSSPSLSSPHSSPIQSQNLPPATRENLRVSSLIHGVFRVLLQPLAAVPRITYPHLSHSNLPTASKERQGFERSRPRRMMNHLRQGQVCPEWRQNLNPSAS